MAQGLNRLKPSHNYHVFARRARVEVAAHADQNFASTLEAQVKALSRMPTSELIAHADYVGVIRNPREFDESYGKVNQPEVQAQIPYEAPAQEGPLSTSLGDLFAAFTPKYQKE